MKKLSILLLGIFYLTFPTLAQNGNWNVNVNDYQYTMSLTAFIAVDGEVLQSTEDKVAVFNGSTCRGVTNLIYVEAIDKYLAYLTIYSNSNNEELSFKIYKSDEDKEVEVQEIITFAIDEHYGDVFQSYSIAEPQLSTSVELEIESFNNVEILDSYQIEDSLFYVVDFDADLTNLYPNFSMSEGASMYQDRVQMNDSSVGINFTDSMVVDVMSEDQSTMKTYTIFVDNRFANDQTEIIYFAVDGIILDSSIDDERVWLLLPFGTQISDVTVDYEISENAYLYYQDSLINSGQKLNLTLGDTLKVVSENLANEQSYVLDIEFNGLGDGVEAQATNVITPNNDGYNDYWIVNEIDRLSEAKFQIYTINGTILYESIGYDNTWNGYYKGQPLPVGNYYYQITNNATGEFFSGEILIVY
ncbi:T9SS type B sorting domain-containing protein [Flammeovirga agarivorans]|uniref:Gliding motility-associated C-terminal domain-containing protein n=1 Tax=Flammeovirga agarivorans TaxID=2726742 RepID=A0A7X8SQX2_9BACT|nr:gliding motility-associated C-terminal domain-containing protein [Flammeovirga agarivorans]NLR94612.1 gliding motility-associated C-terminal domain-containing protein [Flammeovirga agarivorans]